MNVLHGHSNKLLHVGKSTTVEACRGMGATVAGQASLASWLVQGHELARKLVGAVGAWHVQTWRVAIGASGTAW